MALSAIGAKKAGPGRHGDGNGLELHKVSSDAGKWIWRYSFAGKRRQMGLGTYPAVSLADARRERDRWAAALTQGKDPISERKAALLAAREVIERDDPPLDELAEIVLDSIKAKLRGDGKRGRWMSPLAKHVLPKIGRKPVSTIRQVDIRDAIAPIWRKKHPTAQKSIQRLHIIFRQGRLMGYDMDPFTIEAAKHMLGEVIHEAKPIAATPWQEIPALYQRLEDQGAVAQCLRLMILTMVRGTGCRLARFDEFNGDVWTVPAERMKGRVGRVSDFRVPLSDEAVKLVESRRDFGGEYLFSARRGRPITDVSLEKRMNDMGEPGRPHGFRTSFRTWVQDTDACTFDVAETILAHTIGGKVERSYARSDMLERRRPVMQAWSDYVSGASAGRVVAIR